MSEKKRGKILIGALFILLLILVALVALFLDSQSPDPIFGIFQPEPTQTEAPTEETADPTQGTEQTTPGESQPPKTEPTETKPEETKPEETKPQETKPEDTKPEETKPEETKPQETEPEETEPVVTQPTGPVIISFPHEISEYDLVIEKIAPYSGMFVEDGSNVHAENVGMLLVKNNGKLPVEYAQIRVIYGTGELLFDISALPAGERLVVQEKTGKPLPEGDDATSVTAIVVQRPEMDMSESLVQVTDNGDNTLTVKNLTKETIPTVRIFYKYYMEQEQLYVGGIAFTARISRLGAGDSVTIQPSHYTSQTSRVVMVLTYDSEV